MIRSWANSATQRFANDGKSRFSGMDVDAAADLLAALDAAMSINDLCPLRSIGLRKLEDARKNPWEMTINGPWRLCIRFADGDAWDVEILDDR